MTDQEKIAALTAALEKMRKLEALLKFTDQPDQALRHVFEEVERIAVEALCQVEAASAA